MGENKNTLYLDKEGYDRYLEEMKNIEKEILKVRASKYEAFSTTASNSLADNFDFEETERIEVMLICQLKKRQAALNNVVIVEETDKKTDHINLNDCIELTLFIEDEEPEVEKIKLVAYKDLENDEEEYRSISLSSPIGQAIYDKKCGDVVTYQVGSNTFVVKVEEILREKAKQKKKD